jgi:3-hexulose-6-phosphate synthase
VAIDRVGIQEAERIIDISGGMADIIEVGTSLIKDFGLEHSVGVLKKKFPEQTMLADVKTIDEGAYEFRRTFEAGADIATVMGASSHATIRACRNTAREYRRSYMIDLLGLDEKEIAALTAFDDAVFCLHLPGDCGGAGLTELIRNSVKLLDSVKHIAAAGGVRLEHIPFLRSAGIGTLIVGSAITKSDNIKESVEEFRHALVKEKS